MCWGVGGGEERCVGSGKVWESVWGEEVCWHVGRGMGGCREVC